MELTTPTLFKSSLRAQYCSKLTDSRWANLRAKIWKRSLGTIKRRSKWIQIGYCTRSNACNFIQRKNSWWWSTWGEKTLHSATQMRRWRMWRVRMKRLRISRLRMRKLRIRTPRMLPSEIKCKQTSMAILSTWGRIRAWSIVHSKSRLIRRIPWRTWEPLQTSLKLRIVIAADRNRETPHSKS